MFQIVFNKISAAELSQLGTMDQLTLLDEFQVNAEVLAAGKDERFGTISRDGKTLYRFRSQDYRLYFEVEAERVVVHRVLHKNTFSDFKFRSKLPLSEDHELAASKHFWTLIDEGKEADQTS